MQIAQHFQGLLVVAGRQKPAVQLLFACFVAAALEVRQQFAQALLAPGLIQAVGLQNYLTEQMYGEEEGA